MSECCKTKTCPVFLAIIITAVVVGGGAYYFLGMQDDDPVVETTPQVETPDVETPEVVAVPESEKSLSEYFETRMENASTDADFLMKSPEELEFNELAVVEIECPEDADGPCGGDLLILSKEPLTSGDQEFYFAHEGGAGYTYYGPFTDDLEAIVAESTTIDAL